jgi:hypothetical protein
MHERATPDLTALQLLHDLGYSYYRDLTRVRSDDLLVRARAADALHRATAVVYLSEQRVRASLPAPSRENPDPEPALLATIRRLKSVRANIAALETSLRGPAALPDRDFSALIPSDAARQDLVALDTHLLACAEAVERCAPEVEASLFALEQAINDRNALAARGGRG